MKYKLNEWLDCLISIALIIAMLDFYTKARIDGERYWALLFLFLIGAQIVVLIKKANKIR